MTGLPRCSTSVANADLLKKGREALRGTALQLVQGSCRSSSKVTNFGKVVVVHCSIPMSSGHQCGAGSTTGRVQVFGDFTAFRGHHHLPRLPRPPLLKCSAQVFRKPCQALLLSQRQQQSLQPICTERHRRHRCCHSPTTACAATSAHSGPDCSRPPSLLRHIRTAAVLAAVFGVWCCISANTQPSSAFMSVTTALTDAGAPPAGEESWQNLLLRFWTPVSCR